MVSRTLVIEAHKKQPFHMFNLRGLWCSAKDFHFPVVVLLSAILIIVISKQCPVNEVQNQLEFEACRSNRGIFASQDVIDRHVNSEYVSRRPVRQPSLENTFHPSNSFYFPSIIPDFLSNNNASSSLSPLFDEKTHSSLPTVKNLDADSVLSLYDSSGSDSRFYPCDSGAVSLAPGEQASLCFIYFPTNRGLSSGELIIQTSFGGFVVQANGFSVESPYLLRPRNGLENSSRGRGRKNLTFFGRSIAPSSGMKPLTKEVYSKNTGVQIKVSGAERGGLGRLIICNCTVFSLQPGESMSLHTSHQTDFTIHDGDLEPVLTAGILAIPMEAVVVLLFTTFLMYFIVSAIHTLNLFRMCFNWKNGIVVFPQTNEIEKLIAREEEEAVLSECRESVDSSDVPSSPSSVLSVGVHGKRRKRKKKRSSGAGILLPETSSGRSDNSTPSPPLSPDARSTPEKTVEARNPFFRAPKLSQTSFKVNVYSDNEVLWKGENKNRASKPCLAKEVASTAVVRNSGGSLPPSACRSSLLAPHARAPGAKIGNKKSGGLEEKMGVEQRYTYDIWGDHLFGLPVAYRSKKVLCNPSSSPVNRDFESFFLRGPQTLMIEDSGTICGF